MKYIIKRTSKYHSGDTKEELQRYNPCPELNPKPEEVIYYHGRTLPIKEMIKKFPDEDFSGYKNGRGGCYKEIISWQWVLEVNDIAEFTKQVNNNVIVILNTGYNLPVLEIYDTWRE